MTSVASSRFTLETSAPAKLNLALELTGFTPEGFHALRSVMIGVELADTLRIDAAGDDAQFPRVSLVVAGGDDDVPGDDSNLVVRAVRGFVEGTGARLPERLDLRLTKRIPSQAGMGGGSADAAAVLRLLGQYTSTAPARLLEIGARLGSDIPFMIEGGAALAEGRGERLERLAAPHPFWVVLVQPPERVSTVWAYQRFDTLMGWTVGGPTPRPTSATGHVDGLCAALEKGDVAGVAAHLYNDLEQPVFDRYPHLREIPRALRAAGCEGALMTGSGSCFFGLASTRDIARRGVASVRAAGLGRVWLTRTWRDRS